MRLFHAASQFPGYSSAIVPGVVAFVLMLAAAAWGAESSAPSQGRIDFVSEVRPILIKHCLACHGGVKRKGKLSLVSADHPGKAGTSSVTSLIQPGHPDRSELFRRLVTEDADERMPAKGPPLAKREVETIRQWIEQGAYWPRHWSFEPIHRPPSPAVRNKDWVKTPIDRFVLAGLEARGIAPSPQATASVLIRRLYLDLLGLPPEPNELAAFMANPSEEAYLQLVDRLLASPHFGERWGRHWLDAARYADTDGYEVDGNRPSAWHWRDWVIKAINDDLPFDRFTIEQLAGDLLPQASQQQRLATAFHRQTLTNKETGIDAEEYRVYAVMDRVNTTAGVWLGLTAGCAQCHDHPYDPLTQREYYGLFAFFNDAEEAQMALGASPEQNERFQAELAEYAPKLEALRKKLADAPDAEKPEAEALVKELEKKAPKLAGTKVDVMVRRRQARPTYLFNRGDFLDPKKDEAVVPGVLEVLNPIEHRSADGGSADARADRLDLANWLVHPANALTRRVEVNRIWQHLFGQGLVQTPDDFGASGEPPTHPALLDWLAEEFLAQRWSRKAMIRLVVTSATYRQSSRHRPELTQIDPTNQLLHRQNRLRVEAEVVRDLTLASAGLLSPKIGGPSVFPPIPEDLAKIDFRSDMKWVVSRGEDRYRRGMYTFFKRTLPDPNLTMFDCPDAAASRVRRERSNTPLQALARLNNPVFAEAAQSLGARLATMQGSDSTRVAEMLHRCLARDPRGQEAEELLKLLASTRAHYEEHEADAGALIGEHAPANVEPAEAAAWVAIAGVVLNLDEFITRE